MRVVTFDHQFACARALHRVILNDYIEAGAGMQVFRERIVDQAEMLVVQPQRDAVHVQLAATNIADDDSRWLRFTPPKTAEPVTASLPGGARPVTAIVAGLDGSSLVTVIIAGRSECGWCEANRHTDRAVGLDCRGKLWTSRASKLASEDKFGVA
jgi:hypothetical protein